MINRSSKHLYTGPLLLLQIKTINRANRGRIRLRQFWTQWRWWWSAKFWCVLVSASGSGIPPCSLARMTGASASQSAVKSVIIWKSVEKCHHLKKCHHLRSNTEERAERGHNDEPEEQQHTCVKQIFCIDATIVAYLNFSIIQSSMPSSMKFFK